ncbi:LamG-like jellyroll fold domain-containing protein [Planctomycetota bacterium]
MTDQLSLFIDAGDNDGNGAANAPIGNNWIDQAGGDGSHDFTFATGSWGGSGITGDPYYRQFSGVAGTDSAINSEVSGDFAGTYEIWIQPADIINFQAPVFLGNSGVTLEAFSIALNFPVQGAASAEFAGNKGARYERGYNVNLWYHIAVVKTAGAINATTTVYVNGVAQVFTTGVQSGDTPNVSNAPFRLGDFGGAGGELDGKLSICRYYKKALTATEIRQNYNSEAARFNLPVKRYALNGLVLDFNAAAKNGALSTGDISADNDAVWFDLAQGRNGNLENFNFGTVDSGWDGDGTPASNPYCLKLDDINDDVDILIPSAVSPPYTIEMWGYFRQLSQPPGNYAYLVQLRNGATDVASISRYAPDGTNDDRLYSWNGGVNLTQETISGQAWHHVTLLVDAGDVLHIYVDGVEYNLIAPTAHPNSFNQVVMGKYKSNSHFLYGFIAQMRAYNRALNFVEINANLNATLGPFSESTKGTTIKGG